MVLEMGSADHRCHVTRDFRVLGRKAGAETEQDFPALYMEREFPFQ